MKISMLLRWGEYSAFRRQCKDFWENELLQQRVKDRSLDIKKGACIGRAQMVVA